MTECCEKIVLDPASALRFNSGGALTFQQPGAFFLKQGALRDIVGKALRVFESAILKACAGTDQHTSDGPVLASQLRRIIVELFCASQAHQNVRNYRLIGVKFGNVLSDILVQ